MAVEDQDPYAPPPRHRDKSGRFVRYALVAAMLGAGVWGFMEYTKGGENHATLTTPVEEQTVAQNGYRTAEPATPAPTAPSATTGDDTGG